MTASRIAPVERSLSVSWNQEEAFRRFALEFGTWWPSSSHSVGGPQVRRVVLEPQVGGLIYEEHKDGRRFQWGTVLVWEPPRRLAFTFHPARSRETAQHVEVRFTPNEGGTRVDLIATQWENWRPLRQAHRARRGYSMGWAYLLNGWAGRRTPGMRVADAMIVIAKAISWLRGGTAGEIARAGGEIHAHDALSPPRPNAETDTPVARR